MQNLQSGTTLNGGWYVIIGEVGWEKRVTVNGEVNLILCDGAKLTANEGINVAEGNTLRIYGQELGSGTLEAFSGYEHGNTNSAAIGGGDSENLGVVTIYGGKVHAECKENRKSYNLCYAAGIGGGWDGDGGEVTIYGGVVEAIGGCWRRHRCGVVRIWRHIHHVRRRRRRLVLGLRCWYRRIEWL